MCNVQALIIPYPARALWVHKGFLRTHLALLAGLLERFALIGALTVVALTNSHIDGYAWEALWRKLLLVLLLNSLMSLLACFLTVSCRKLRGAGQRAGGRSADVSCESWPMNS